LNTARIVRRMSDMKRILAVAVMLVAVGCTPGMHKAYQVTMASMATAAWACDAMQTNAALASGMAVETNLLNGENPGPARIWTSTAASSALVWGVVAIPTERLGDRDTGDYLKDMLVTAAAVGEMAAVRSNAMQLQQPMYRCGR
jgi:hypothetical protein